MYQMQDTPGKILSLHCSLETQMDKVFKTYILKNVGKPIGGILEYSWVMEIQGGNSSVIDKAIERLSQGKEIKKTKKRSIWCK